MPSFVFLKGILVLALGHASTFHSSSNIVWLSSKHHLKVQTHEGRITLYPVQKGELFMSGLKVNRDGLVRVVVTTPANVLALEKCKSRHDFDIDESFVRVRKNTEENLTLLCGFDELSLTRDLLKNHEKLFHRQEFLLQKSGIKIGLAQNLRGRRQLTIHSSVPREIIFEKISPELRPYYEILTRNQVTPGRNLTFELTLFEFSTQRARKLGLKFPQSVSFLSLDKRGIAESFLRDFSSGSAQDITLQADFGESYGVGKVLAQPTLRTQPGIESKFLSGGEFPVKNSNALQSQTTWKSYGLKVSLTPSANTQIGDTEVAVDFKMEFSEPDLAHAIDGVPALTQRQLDGHFDLRIDELTILTTMLTLREGSGRAGAAFLSQLPLIGYAFGQDTKIRRDAELYFAIKPKWDDISVRKSSNFPMKNSFGGI